MNPEGSDLHVDGLMGRSASFLTRMYESLKTRVAARGWVSQAEFAQVYRVARAHAGGRGKARRRAAETIPPEDDDTDEDEQDDPDSTPTGVMIAYMLDPEEANRLAVDGGESADRLHITLLYLGDAADMPLDVRQEIASQLGAYCASVPPLDGEVSGVGRFNPSPGSDGKYVVYASVDMPGLEDLQDDLSDLMDACGCEYSDSHGFTPHITLRYDDAVSPLPQVPTVPLTLDDLSLVFAGAVQSFPLTGALFMASSAPGAQRVAIECAEAVRPDQEWIQLVPPPGVYDHPSWGSVTITREMNEAMVSHHQAGEYQPWLPLDLEHETQLSGAAAWITDLRQASDGSVEGQVTWLARGKRLLAEDAFRFISPTWYPEWTQPDTGKVFHHVLVGAALTNRPFFKPKAGLRPLVAAREDTVTEEEKAQQQKDQEAATARAAAEQQAAASRSAEQTISPAQFAEVSARLAAVEAQNSALKAANEANAAELKAAKEQQAAWKAGEQLRRFTEEVTGRSPDNGVAWFGEVEKNVGILTKMANAFGEDAAEVRDFITQQRAVAEQMASSAVFTTFGRTGRAASETGPGSSGVVARVDAQARSYQEKHPNVTIEAARVEVLRGDPRLFTEYDAARKKEIKSQ